MNIKYLKNILPPQDGAAKITTLAWAPNNFKLAVATADRVIILFDEQGERRDKFSTKPADSKYGKKSYIIKAIAFSPDSTKIAIGQSDNIIYVYRIGEDWGEKKVICNKFVQSSQVTCLTWPFEGPIIFGLLEGKVRAANIKTNNLRGTGFLSGHADGSVVRFYIAEDPTSDPQGKIISHPVPPYALCWTNTGVVIGGSDKRIVMYSRNGKIEQQFDFSRDATEREFTTIACSPSGQAVVVGSYDRLRVFDFNSSKGMWEEKPSKEFQGIYTITALSLEKGWFSSGKDRYLVARTTETLLLGDLHKNLLSEVQWMSEGVEEKFYFDNENVCMIFRAGELSLVEYGNNEILESVRTEFMNPHLISVRLNERPQRGVDESKKMAYLLDLKTICLRDLLMGVNLGQINHDSRIDWLELNETGQKLLFRDKKLRLILIDIETLQKIHMLSYSTFVIVQDGHQELSYALDEGLIEFRTAIDDGDYLRAMNYLEERTEFDNFEVQAKLAILNKQFKTAEGVLIDNNDLDAAMNMYQSLHKWDEAVELAEMKGHADVENLKKLHMQWLLDTHQEGHAGEIKEKEGNPLGAISLYLSAGRPAKAATIIATNIDLQNDSELVSTVADALLKAELFERAGELYEKVGLSREALQKVVRLEEEWGDELVLSKQPDAAISHYIEAGHNLKALEAAIAARQWKKANQICEVIDDEEALAPHLMKLAQHYASLNDLKSAEKFYVRGHMYKEAIEMYNQAGEWERAHQLASKHMNKDEVAVMYVKQAQQLEQQGKLRQAEKLFVFVNEPDLAITMYKNHRQFDQMINLVKQYHPDLVQSTHMHLANEMEQENNYREAEKHYIAAGDWKAAVNMYRTVDMWEEAHRVAKDEGGSGASKQVAFLWARTLRGEAAVKLLNKFGILEQCIDYCCENLQTMENIPEAEEQFIKAGKPKEAVLMYVHAQDWESAQRVAETHDSESVADVLVGQAKVAFTDRDYPKAEALLLRAQRPELAIKFYRDVDQWREALRVCKEYLPHKLKDLQDEYDKAVIQKGSNDAQRLLDQAKQWEESGEYARAVDCYSKVTASMTPDVAVLEKAWIKAGDLAAKTSTGGPQLMSMKPQIFIAGDQIKEAIDAFIAAREWNKARKVAQELEPRYESYVEQEHQRFLEEKGDTDGLEKFDITSALDVHVKKGQWSTALEKAAKHDSFRVWADLRDILFKLVANLQQQAEFENEVEEFGQAQEVAHYYALRSAAHGVTPQLDKIAAQITVSILRHTNIIPADKAFYEAGMSSKQMGWTNMTFVFLNHFLDLCEAIEEGSIDSLDHADFMDTDIPYEIPLPEKLSIPDNLREEAKEWVLAVSMDQQVEQSLPIDDRGVYEASLVNQDGSYSPPCVVTGYPVLHNAMSLKHGQVANKDDWNKVLMTMKMTNSVELHDVVKYITNRGTDGPGGILGLSFHKSESYHIYLVRKLYYKISVLTQISIQHFFNFQHKY
ncbi:Intraflagellar transport protein [Armadillidium nasatum]|uniref:Intraflagellar transport protein n=1 Tax=Armadillidium nasatum TaxID=96803 RepID=A0A5N5TIG9_9CRUS|nr:Intraflagellar transport protein [Armadillidium nasatum]